MSKLTTDQVKIILDDLVDKFQIYAEECDRVHLGKWQRVDYVESVLNEYVQPCPTCGDDFSVTEREPLWVCCFADKVVSDSVEITNHHLRDKEEVFVTLLEKMLDKARVSKDQHRGLDQRMVNVMMNNYLDGDQLQEVTDFIKSQLN